MDKHIDRGPESQDEATPNGIVYSQWDHAYSDYFNQDQTNNLLLLRWLLNHADNDLQTTDMAPADPLHTIAPIPPQQPGNKLSTQYRGEDGQLHDTHGRY